MEVTRKGSPYQTEGQVPQVGELVPDFVVVSSKDDELRLDTLKGQVTLISVVPDINTSVCDIQTKKFNQEIAALDDIQLVTVSTNTKEDFLEWCAGNGVDMLMASDTQRDFGKKYGIYIPELDVDQRAVFLLDKEGRLVYKEILVEMVDQPNYEVAIEEAKALRE
ncbi:thiol peroxidase [Granulicatella seriolae]|uniref:Thiol peroxidase n=1 Tax=Granulicatella seriolae TaxID=2967226 RepID=A0ABT1WQ93_9LACT|nr:thiol peroxidase [Granulicatella seriolae]